MNLKNRFAAIATIAAIAIPAVAFAAKYVKAGDSTITIKASAGKGTIPIKATGGANAITVVTDGPNTIIKLDGWNLTTGTTFTERNEHMKEMIFGWSKADADAKKKQSPDAEKKRYFELIVATDKIEKGLADGKIDAIIKTPRNGAGKPVSIKAFKRNGDSVHGEFETTMPTLGFPTETVCKKLIKGFDASVCVADKIEVSADLGIKKE
jgi:hypothetical protein